LVLLGFVVVVGLVAVVHELPVPLAVLLLYVELGDLFRLLCFLFAGATVGHTTINCYAKE
jgi:hypothetical protein